MPGSSEDYAAMYGWALSVLRSDRGLWNTFNLAVKGNWSPARFASAVRGTTWYKTRSEAARQAVILQKSDPATYSARRNQIYAQIRDQSRAMGARLNNTQMWNIASNALVFGYNDAQIKEILGNYAYSVQGSFYGEAQKNYEKLDSYARSMGYNLGSPGSGSGGQRGVPGSTTLNTWMRSIAKGEYQLEDYMTIIRRQAEQMFPMYADAFKRGQTAADVAAPYIQSYAQILERNPASINLFDPKLRAALSHVDPKTGKPAVRSLTDWENELRKDPSWRKTKNAQDQTQDIAHQLLRQMGVVAV